MPYQRFTSEEKKVAACNLFLRDMKGFYTVKQVAQEIGCKSKGRVGLALKELSDEGVLIEVPVPRNGNIGIVLYYAYRNDTNMAIVEEQS